ncbi:aminotransferase class V-fold PLP-dependent enzyme [Nonomuraea sp. NPDC050663]|uniref:aminotransferase class V-fold PLP-dependent enzyme n=1 Tax=Nonomuraea sp. NPDC050663 TaxID=3364370 RepID=UPI0037BCC128
MLDRLVKERELEFPITRSRIFMAHAAFSPLPARVAAAVCDLATALAERGQGSFLEDPIERGAREAAGRMLAVPASDIAFVLNTSTGVSLVASAVDWRPGDNVVVAAGDFPSASDPWRRHGIEVREADVWSGPFLDLVDDRTRAVCVSTVNFASGQAVRGLEDLRERGVLVVVDAIQTLGTQPFDASPYDVVVADGHKWLLAPKGCALMYVSPRAAEQLVPPVVGWRNMTTERPYGPGLDLVAGAGRFEAGSPNVLGIAGMGEALRMFGEVGLDAIEERLAELRSALVTILLKHGLADDAWAPATPLISLPLAQERAESLYRHLEAARISTSVRHDVTGQCYLRFSPHFYNTLDDLARLEEEIGAWSP